VKIITWNVNSVRVRQEQVSELLRTSSPDVLLLQEIKCLESEFPTFGGHSYVSGQRAGNGVAVIAKDACEVVRTTLPGFAENEARYLEVLTGGMRLINVYVPFGQSIDDPKFDKKIRFLSCLRDHLRELLFNEERIIVGGDFNVAIEPIDTYATVETAVCYAPAVRRLVHSILHLGYFDVYRALNPGSTEYTWWDYRSRCYERNAGMRLDYFLVSPQAMDSARESEILKEYRALERPSDHVPVVQLCS
jgi:exodeoxyribonuclease-3